METLLNAEYFNQFIHYIQFIKESMQRQQQQQARTNQNKQQKIMQNMEVQEVKEGEVKNCEFYVSRKRRFCKFQPIKGSKFCAAHCSDQADKVQCPYQKGMFIDAAKLEKHLQICPRIKTKKAEQQSQWFTKGVNLNKTEDLKQAVHIDSIEDINKDSLIKTIRKVINLFLACYAENPKLYIQSTEQQKIENLTNDHTQAHLLAQAALKAGLIREDIIYLEFGAGKGILSYHLALKVKEQCKRMSKNVLLERQVRRNKFDRFMKDNPYFQRFKSDVSDFDVSKLPITMAETAKLKKPQIDVQKQAAQLNQLQIVGVCKHMCGAALDISVRALQKTKMSGCILASCCHQLCSYQTYLNNPFFQNSEQKFTPDEIQIVFKISAWGTKSSVVKEEQINFEQLKNLKQYNEVNGKLKIIIGRICKRLIDYGRAQVLKCQVRRYCSDQITPENFVIISI